MKILALIFSLSAASVQAHPFDKLDPTELFLMKMRVAWECQNAIGPAFYSSARAMAMVGLSRIYDDETTKGYVSEMDSRLQSFRKRAPNTISGATLCYRTLSDLNYRIELLAR